MENLQSNGIRLLSKRESYQINGGQAEGSYDLGYRIGSSIRNFFKSLRDATEVLNVPRPIGMY